MISTITTTVTTVATLAVGSALGALATFLLISLLSAKELVTADQKQSLKTFGKSLDVSVFPLFIVFSLIVAFNVIAVL